MSNQGYVNKFLNKMKTSSLESMIPQYVQARIQAPSPVRDPLLVKALRGSKANFVITLLKVWYSTEDVRVMWLLKEHARQIGMFGSNIEFDRWLSTNLKLGAVFKAMRDDDDVMHYASVEMFQANPEFLPVLMNSANTPEEFLTLQGYDTQLKRYTPKVTACDYKNAFPQLIQCLKTSMAPHVQYETLGKFFDNSVALNWAKKTRNSSFFRFCISATRRNSSKLCWTNSKSTGK